MFNGFAKRIEALERQISLWESKAKKEDKWKKCMEMWLLKNFDFDLQENLSKLTDSDDVEEKPDLKFDEPATSYNNCFPLAPKQVYNNPHLIIESQPQPYEAEQVSGISFTKTSGQPQRNENEPANSQFHSQQYLQIQPAHLNSQQTHPRGQLSYSNSDQNKSKERFENLQRTKVANVVDRKSSPSSVPISLQKVPHVHAVSSSSPTCGTSNPHPLSHFGSSITLTPLRLPAHTSQASDLQLENNTPAHLSNNIRHNITSLIGSTNSISVKEEEVHDNEREQEWQEEEDSLDASPHFQNSQLEIHKRNTNHEGSSEGRNSPLYLDTSDDIEEISVDQDEHNTTGFITGDIQDHVFKESIIEELVLPGLGKVILLQPYKPICIVFSQTWPSLSLECSQVNRC
ncbi:unnamed protein product [Allacma fusca]|uniref:Uncharacterized protein n=1 Tax=Allacma fusca TaxID=39272 RepID=A0A8J2J9Q9_9HEXA|nr:unnamed protein product [Allacma fusca]